MSAGVTVVKIIVEQLLLHTLWPLVYRLLHANRRDVPNLSRYVAARDVRSFAIRENNSVAIKVYDDAVQAHEERQSNLSQLSHLSFSCLVLVVLGLCLPGERGSLWQMHLLAFSEGNTVAGMGAQMFCIGLWLLPTPWLYRFFGDTYPILWIEYPPLAEKTG